MLTGPGDLTMARLLDRPKDEGPPLVRLKIGDLGFQRRETFFDGHDPVDSSNPENLR
jgi:hypothetical protein